MKNLKNLSLILGTACVLAVQTGAVFASPIPTSHANKSYVSEIKATNIVEKAEVKSIPTSHLNTGYVSEIQATNIDDEIVKKQIPTSHANKGYVSNIKAVNILD